MKRLSLLGLLVLAGCTGTGNHPVDPVGQFHYGAIGHDPFWLVAIGDERIVLTLGPEGGRADGELQSYQYPRALPREENGARRWESRAGGQALVVTARQVSCSSEGRSYPDTVELRLGRRVLKGCGGREMGGRS